MQVNISKFVLLGLLAGGMTAVAKSDDGRPQGAPPSRGGPPPQEIMERFDTDGDGQLSESERKAMHEAMRARRQGKDGDRPTREDIMERFDKDGDGQLNEEERQAMREARMKHRSPNDGDRNPRMNREEMLERFDADGDGKLSKEERQAMKDALQAERPEPPASAESGQE